MTAGAALFSDAPPAPAVAVSALRDLDLDVLDLVADGLTTRDAARKLHVGESTVKNALQRLGDTFDCRERAGIVGAAYRRGLLQAPANPPDGRGVLTLQEHEVLLMVARGMGNAQIGEWMSLSVGQVKDALKRVFKKLGASGREHAVRRAVELGVLTLVPKGGGDA